MPLIDCVKNNMKEKLDVLIIILLGIGLTLLTIFYAGVRGDMTMIVEKEGFSDFTNWVSIIVTIGASVTIAVSILNYTKTEQDKINKIIGEQNSIRQKKRNFAIKKISLLLSIIDDILKEDSPDYEDARENFNKITNIIGFFSDSLDSIETQNILELSEIGELMCKNNGILSLRSDSSLPFTTDSIPANLSALRSLIQQNLQKIVEKNELKCFCGNFIPCSIHVNESISD